jgi:hypothetical protein
MEYWERCGWWVREARGDMKPRENGVGGGVLDDKQMLDFCGNVEWVAEEIKGLEGFDSIIVGDPSDMFQRKSLTWRFFAGLRLS